MATNIDQRAYDQGYIDGLTAYAHMKDGTTYVGTTGRTLKDAVANRKETYNYVPVSLTPR
jgi:hypothetical protein